MSFAFFLLEQTNLLFSGGVLAAVAAAAVVVVVVVVAVLHPGGTCASRQPEGPTGGKSVWAAVRVRCGFAGEVREG